VQSALEVLRGVKEVKVSLGDEEVTVLYDDERVKVEDLIRSVNAAQGMSKYQARELKK
jgi:copper chaperone CopZ